MKKTYQLHISLKHIVPEIWRRVLVPASILLPDLHQVIQIVIGWDDAHLHQFEVNGEYFAPPSADDWDGLPTEDYEEVQLQDVLSEKGSKIIYEYDFGDSWEHIIVLEEILPWEKKHEYPQCLDGKNFGPLEDCGGPYGYMALLENINNPKHSLYQWMMNVTQGQGHDPSFFNKKLLNLINEDLRNPNNYGRSSYNF